MTTSFFLRQCMRNSFSAIRYNQALKGKPWKVYFGKASMAFRKVCCVLVAGHCEGGTASSAPAPADGPATRPSARAAAMTRGARRRANGVAQGARVSARKTDSNEPEKVPEMANPVELGDDRNAPEMT